MILCITRWNSYADRKMDLVLRTTEAVLNTIPEKSIKHTMNEMYRTIFIRLRMIITRVIRSIENGANSRINFQNSG